MAVVPSPENSFTLNYNQVTDVRLFRQGSVKEPIDRDLRRRCMNSREFRTRRMNNYREGNREARTDNLRGIDFLLDDEEQILTEESSGNNTFLRNLSRSFTYSLLGKNSFVANIRSDCLFLLRTNSLRFGISTKAKHYLESLRVSEQLSNTFIGFQLQFL